VKWLSILVLLVVALPAHGAISLKDWQQKSGEDQTYYLGACVVSLTADVAKTDPALALKIKNYYSEKVPGHKYPEGTTVLFTRIIQLEQQAKEGKADLSKIEVEDIVYSVTAEKFKLPSREAPQDVGDFRDAAPAPSTAPQSAPMMLGKIDVSHFAGLKPGDPRAKADALYGKAATDYGTIEFFGDRRFQVSYLDGTVKTIELSSSDLDFVRSHAAKDDLLNLFGRTEAEAIALLGTPRWRQDENGGAYTLYWAFAMPGKPAGKYADLSTEQTLVLGVRAGMCCYWLSINW
jgi:hypothetical protein